jgi:ribosome maturation factor RimP
MATDSPLIQRIRAIVEPIASDLDLDLYDIEQRGATIRVTIDTRPGQPGGVDLEQIALATRLISRELDHQDPVPGKYTLEVTSPGVERSLRTPAHFRRELGKTVNVRLANVDVEQRRLEGVLIAADERTATVLTDDGVEHPINLADVDRARTVFQWGPQPKPGQPRKAGAKKPGTPDGKRAASPPASEESSNQPAPSESAPESVKESS